MLKRLSFNSSEPNLLPPSLSPKPSQSPLGSPRLPLSPKQQSTEYFPSTANATPAVERQTLHKSLQSLSNLLVVVDELRDLNIKLAKCEKRLSKGLRELAQGFGERVETGARNDMILNALAAGATMFETLSDIDSKHAKIVQKEYESLNDMSGKFFKKIAKEEKSYDESITSIDAKIQRETTSYERSRPRSRPSLAEATLASRSHDTYILSLSSLSNQISALKLGHAESIGEKRETVMKFAAGSMCGLAEGEWKKRLEGVKRGGEKYGEVVYRGLWCLEKMPRDSFSFDDGGSTAPSTTASAPSVNATSGTTTSNLAPDSAAKSPTATNNGTNLSRAPSTVRGPRPIPTHTSQGSSETVDSNALSTNSYSNQQPPHLGPSSNHIETYASVKSLGGNGANTLGLSNSSSRATLRAAAEDDSRKPTYLQEEEQPRNWGDQQQQTQPRFIPIPTSSQQATQTSYSTSPPTSYGGKEPSQSSTGTENSSQPRPSFSTRTSADDGRNVQQTLPRGFTMEDVSKSPPSNSRAWEVQRPTPQYNPPAFLREGLEEEREEDSVAMKRSDTTASERSFVAKMKEKYLEEKNKVNATASREQQPQGRPPPPPRSSSVVSTLAQRYTVSSNEDEQVPRPRPTHRYSNSYQPTSNSFMTPPTNEFGQLGTSPPKPWTADQPRSYSRQSLPPVQQPHSQQDQPHHDLCGCESCSNSKYKNERGRTAEEEEMLQRSFRAEKESKRVSFPWGKK